MGRGRLGCVEWSCPENTTKGREGYRSQMAFSRRYRPIHRTPQSFRIRDTRWGYDRIKVCRSPWHRPPVRVKSGCYRAVMTFWQIAIVVGLTLVSFIPYRGS